MGQSQHGDTYLVSAETEAGGSAWAPKSGLASIKLDSSCTKWI